MPFDGVCSAPAMDREARVRRVLLIEGLANFAVLVAKTAVGLSTGSAAILSDAVHSLADLFNNVMAWIATRLAAAPPDRDHPYGHRKYEPLAVFALATFLSVMAIEVVLRGIESGKRDIIESKWGLVLMLGVLTANIGVSLWEARWARRLDSDLLRADVRHTTSDVAITLAVIAGWQGAVRGHPWLDSVFAVGIAFFILSLAYGLFKRAIPSLVDAASTDPDKLAEAVARVPGVRRTRRVRSAGAGAATRIDVTVGVDPSLSTLDSHAIADEVERLLAEEFSAQDVTVHVEPDVARHPGRS
jgi:cation diffusion facilitator family transporter